MIGLGASIGGLVPAVNMYGIEGAAAVSLAAYTAALAWMLLGLRVANTTDSA